jgi:hypothetical protein
MSEPVKLEWSGTVIGRKHLNSPEVQCRFQGVVPEGLDFYQALHEFVSQIPAALDGKMNEPHTIAFSLSEP